jgi:hypothetical protein
MFHLSYTSPHEGPVETLRFHVDPRRRGLGIYTDVDGVQWDVYAIMGQHINARKVSEHPRYYGTAIGDNSNGSHVWPPYKVEVVPRDQ